MILALIMTLPMGLNWTGDMYDMPIAREFSTEKRQTDEERETAQGTDSTGWAPLTLSPLERTFWARTTLGALTRCSVADQSPHSMVGCDVVANDTDLSVAEVAPAFWPPLLVLVLALVGDMCQKWGMCCCKGTLPPAPRSSRSATSARRRS